MVVGGLMQKRVRHWSEVLKYSSRRASQSVVHRHYSKYRAEAGLLERCDNPECTFYVNRLHWNGRPLPVILDHNNGVRCDNRPENLWYLCPNCDSQRETRGGRNRGRVELSEGGYAIKARDGRRHYRLPTESGRPQLTGYAPQVISTEYPTKA